MNFLHGPATVWGLWGSSSSRKSSQTPRRSGPLCPGSGLPSPSVAPTAPLFFPIFPIIHLRGSGSHESVGIQTLPRAQDKSEAASTEALWKVCLGEMVPEQCAGASVPPQL